MADLPPRLALVYDWVNKWGGAERVLLALHELFPQAPLYTSVYRPSSASWAEVFPQVIPTFLNGFPLSQSHHELYASLTPLAFDSLDLRDYDAVISLTSADAKGLITSPSTFHLCYCLTPTRYLWSHAESYRQRLGYLGQLLSAPVFNYLRMWDLVASRRPDAYVSISQTVQRRLQTYYHLPSQIVYPPVDISAFAAKSRPPAYHDYFLYVGRLVSYKRPDLVVDLFNKLNYNLVIVGSGECEHKLRLRAGPNIHFTGQVDQSALVSLYQYARAVIFLHEEDFGLVPVEAMAAGTPVIALNCGGAAETVIHNLTGCLVDSDSLDDLAEVITNFSPHHFHRRILRSQAAKFSVEHFKTEFVKVFTKAWETYKNTYEIFRS